MSASLDPPDLPSPAIARRADQLARQNARQNAWKREHRAKLRATRPARVPRPRAQDRPFIGVDGEGCGVDELGRQLYMLLRCGDRELFTGRPLGAVECLRFLLDAPRDVFMVGFSFGYDVTQILRDLPAERVRRILADKEIGAGHSRYTYVGDIGIEYLPKNYLRVCRLERVPKIGPDGLPFGTKLAIVRGSTRTIWETFGFFQTSFLKALKAFDIGTDEQRASIEANKALRGEIAEIDAETRAYCAAECDLLAQLMERFREICFAADIKPRSWSGAGKLSAAMHEKRRTVTAAQLVGLVAADVLQFASDAYYGGRFEVSRVGAIRQPIWENDIHSAYPAAMRDLPCLLHGTWEAATGTQLHQLAEANPAALFVARLAFDHPARPLWCGLPIRQPDGRLYWPYTGRGTYWAPEIRAAEAIGCTVKYRDGWRYVTNCECRPFDWVEPLYHYRKTLAADAGVPIKLGINGLYGKLVQRIGNPRWSNFVWGGLITAMTRARLLTAVALDPEAIVMLATDAVFSLRPLALPVTEELGDWDQSEWPQLFITQPGLYWGAKRPKTRGVPSGFFDGDRAAEDGTPLPPWSDVFEAAWLRYAENDRAVLRAGDGRPPVIAVPIKLFTGIKLAVARNKPETAGRWTQAPRNFNFDWSKKRRAAHQWESATHVLTYPAYGGATSRPHKRNSEASLLADLDRMELEDQPDYFTLAPSGNDSEDSEEPD
jgi:hypothetical protein